MARRRKTIDVKRLREYINGKLESPKYTQDEKKALALLLEEFLHSTDNYHGYNWIYWLRQGYNEWKAAGEPDWPEKDKFIFGGTRQEHDWDRVYF